MFGQDPTQEEISASTDARGVIAKSMAQRIRDIRSAEYWERYDSIVVGPGAANLSRGWFNSWAAFAAADQLSWFSGRDTAVGGSFCNTPNERTDFAQDLFQSRIECKPLFTPMADLVTDPMDAQFMPFWWASVFPENCVVRTVLAEADEISKAPASHYPCGYGLSGAQIVAAPAPMSIPGQQGEAHVSNSWKWPEPVMLAAKAKLTNYASIDQPTRAMLAGIAGPGNILVPDGAGGVVQVPCYYVMRVAHCGPRYLQLRGARSA